ncbi:MAG TPA: hypothetical protein VHY58_16425 [Streptosporangiaceae bacterium]|jgi:hypothetical protein|nr:hypothetical protein [Streptosporangiaceae bacterium]
MIVDAEHLEQARKVADAILYEGYLLYPYRKSAQKNQARFQFGVLMPPAYQAVDSHEPSASRTECLLEARDGGSLWVLARFLHLRRRTVQAPHPVTGELRDVDSLLVDGSEYSPWDEASDREFEVTVPLADLLDGGAQFPVHVDTGQEIEELTDADGIAVGRLTHRWGELDAVIKAEAERIPGPYGVMRLRISLENHTLPRGTLGNRADGLGHALISAHLLIGADGTFLSMTDPPEWASQLVAGCTNTGTWPVLAGPADCGNLMMSSPIILYDHPEIAAESAGDLFDATEIDEILTLRTLTLTDAEKAEARMTDPRAADLLDRLDGLPPEMLEKMHGAIRYLEPSAGPVSRKPAAPPQYVTPTDDNAVTSPSTPWWDPGSDSSVSPETDHVVIGGAKVARGSKVVLRPGARRADAQDLFLAGREADVEAVLFDVDGQVHVAVTLVSDALEQELQRIQGRFLYFSPDEIEPVEPGRLAEGHASGHKEEMS